jgi:hypothetical protein
MRGSKNTILTTRENFPAMSLKRPRSLPKERARNESQDMSEVRQKQEVVQVQKV